MSPRKRRRQERGKGSRSHNRGSLVMDITVEGVRIRRATGTNDPEQFGAYVGAVKLLGASGRVDILRQLTEKRNGRFVLRLSELWDAVRPHRDRPANLNRLPSPLTLRKLWTVDGQGALERWAETRTSAADLRNKRRDVRALRRFATVEQTVGDLPSILEAYREYCEARETFRTFDMARWTLQAFLRDTVKRSHPLYGAVLEIQPFRVPSKAGKPLTPPELATWLARVEQEMSPMYADAFLAMSVTGMRLCEFWGEWSILADRVRLRGAKRKRGEVAYRETPRIAVFREPEMAQRTFESAFGKVGLNALHTPYDARRTFARACEESHIPESRRKAYMGHNASTVSDLYVRHEVTPFLADDAAKLKAYLMPALSRTFSRTEGAERL